MLLVPLLAVLAGVTAALQPAPVFKLDLARPPTERWRGAVQAVLQMHPWEYSFGPLLSAYNTTTYVLLTPGEVSVLHDSLRRKFPSHLGEVEGIAADFALAGHPEVTVEFLAMMVWWHELAHIADLKVERYGAFVTQECTGILAVPAGFREPIIHGRNLDQGTPSGRNVTLDIRVVNGSQQLYNGYDFYWFSSGFVTAQVPGYVTLEENWRTGPIDRATAFAQIASNDAAVIPQVLMFRFVAEGTHGAPGVPKFDAVVQYLTQTANFVAPFYAILSGYGGGRDGARMGAVLAVGAGRNGTRSATISDDTIAAGGDWYLVQTNYDWWVTPLSDDRRRAMAMQQMALHGRAAGATTLGVWQSISAYPVKNTWTFYTVVATYADSLWQTSWVRRSMVPGNESN